MAARSSLTVEGDDLVLGGHVLGVETGLVGDVLFSGQLGGQPLGAVLVEQQAGEALALPTDRVRIPTERELFLFGEVASSPKRGAAAEVARQDFSSSYGYVME